MFADVCFACRAVLCRAAQLLYITPAGILVSLYYREGMPGFGAVMRTVITVLLIVCCGLFLAYIPVHSMRFGLGKTFNYK